MLGKMQNELLGAMVGLVRTADKNGKTADTDRVLLEGLLAVRDGSAGEENILRVRKEKAKAAPGCAMCAMPCGSTADADMEALWNGGAEAVSARKAILDILCGAADEILRRLNRGDVDEEVLFLVHKGLFFLGEDTDAAELRDVLTELEVLKK